MPLTRVMTVYPTCILFIPTKMKNRVGVNFAIFRSNPWRQFIVLLEICCKDTNVHESVENKISHVLLHKGSKCQSCQV